MKSRSLLLVIIFHVRFVISGSFLLGLVNLVRFDSCELVWEAVSGCHIGFNYKPLLFRLSSLSGVLEMEVACSGQDIADCDAVSQHGFGLGIWFEEADRD